MKGLAIDGKTLGNSHTEDARRTHLLAAVFHELGIPVAECAVSEKTNEIPVSLELLKAFDVTGLVITTDALLTQRKFCQEILEHQADYCLPVKANQKQLYEDIRDLFEPFDETDPPESTAGLKIFTQKPERICKRIPTQKTQKAGLPHAPSPQVPS